MLIINLLIAAPRNIELSGQFLLLALEKSSNEKEKLEVEYIKLYLQKLEAIERGDEQGFQDINSALIQLSEDGQP